jgi:predicted nucleic acid-binding protein
MARRVIIDTGVIIAFERGKLDIDAVLGADDAAISAATAMELLAGSSATAGAEDRVLLTTDASADFAELTWVNAELLKVE